MKRAEAKIYLDYIRPRKDNTCAVKVCVTHNRVRKYYPTGIYLAEADFSRVISGKRRSNEEKVIASKLVDILGRANAAIERINHFTFSAFECAFSEDQEGGDVGISIFQAFEDYIKQLKRESRLGTASSYECAMKSLSDFRKDLTFDDITVDFLKSYEDWMLGNGRSLTTVGFYLRNLRAIYNQNHTSHGNTMKQLRVLWRLWLREIKLSKVLEIEAPSSGVKITVFA